MAPLAQGHAASKWQSWDLKPGLTGPGSVLPGTETWGGLERQHWPGWTGARNKSPLILKILCSVHRLGNNQIIIQTDTKLQVLRRRKGAVVLPESSYRVVGGCPVPFKDVSSFLGLYP